MTAARSLRCLLLLSAAAFFLAFTGDAGLIGVNYGRVADNLPSPAAVVQLLKSQSIGAVKIYDSSPEVLRALAGSGIKVVVSLPNEQVAAAARRPSYALAWARRSVAAFLPATQIHAVAVGNEVFAGAANLTSLLVPAMVNVDAALTALGVNGTVKVSSPLALTALASSFPPSAGAFRNDLAEPVIRPMLDFLRRTGAPLMVNAYPFFAYEANAGDISLDYALFRPNDGVLDSGSGLKYYSLLDAQLDALIAAVARLGADYSSVPLVVSETGWPSRGDANETGANAANAAAYNGNLVRRVLSSNAGTPRRPDGDLDVYIFALFNEDNKTGPSSERNYGLFYPDQRKVSDISFVLGGAGSGGGARNSGWQEEGGKTVTTSPSSTATAAAAANKEAWCVANAMAGEQKLQAALDYACGEGGADCSAIQPGAACFEPNTVAAHATYAFNSYYQRKGRSIGACYFGGAAYVVNQPPEIGKCELPSTA